MRSISNDLGQWVKKGPNYRAVGTLYATWELTQLLGFEQSKKRHKARGDCSRTRFVIYTLDHLLDSNRKEWAWRRASAIDPSSWRVNTSHGSWVSSYGCATPSALVAPQDSLSATPSTASSSRRPTKHTSTCGW